MGIKITLKTKKTTYEGRFTLNFRRERTDIAELLKELQKGRTLRSIFEGNDPVANAVSKKLNESSYIDSMGRITTRGQEFIDYPFFSESEKGVYALGINHIEEDGLDIYVATRVERKLSEREGSLAPVSLPNYFQGNEFSFANDRKEVGVMQNVELLSGGKAYVFDADPEEIVFDVQNATYQTDGTYKMGEILGEAVRRYAMRLIESKVKHFLLTDDLKIEVANLEDFSDKDLLDGQLSKYEVGPISLTNVPFLIKDTTLAKRYAYLWLYDLLMQDNYYSLSEMSEIVQNEISAKPIIDSSIKGEIGSMAISKEGFKKFLPAEKYAKLDYKLHIMNEYLGIDSVVEDANFSRVHDYRSLAQFLAEKVGSSEISRIYLVMGYALVNRHDNRIRDCLEQIRQSLSPNVIIVSKKGKTAVEEEPGLREALKEKGICVIDKTGISDYFHDRYVIFEKKDGTFTSFLCTAEIGQIFKESETKGTIIPIPNSDLVKAGRNLLSMIKE